MDDNTIRFDDEKYERDRQMEADAVPHHLEDAPVFAPLTDKEHEELKDLESEVADAQMAYDHDKFELDTVTRYTALSLVKLEEEKQRLAQFKGIHNLK